MRSDNNIPIQAVLKRFALIYLSIAVVLSIVLLLSARLEQQSLDGAIKVRENSRIELTKGLVTRDFSAVKTDLRIAAHLPSLRRYLDSGNTAQREELEKLLLVLAEETQRYDQVRYLDASGQELIRINYNDGKPVIVPNEQLQNKSGRYYFDDAFKLNQGQIFISPLDLNIEHGHLEIPYKPMIRFATPVFDSTGKKKGIILLNYFGNELLLHFHAAMQGNDPHSSMLLNRDGYWLSTTKQEDEWGFMLDKKQRTFGNDFPEEWRAISAAERGVLLTDRGLFVYNTVYPLLPEARSATGSALANAPSQKELSAHEYDWKIVSFVPHADLSGAAFYNRASGRIFLVLVYLLLGLFSFFIAFVSLKRKQVDEELRIAATAFETEEGIMITDQNSNIIRINRAFTRLTGYSAEDVIGKTPALLHSGRQDSEFYRSMWERLVRDKYWQGEIWNKRKNGEVYPEWLTVTGVAGQGGVVMHYVAVFSDITQRKEMEEKISFLAYHDKLTGLTNRTLFYDRLSQAMSQSRRSDNSFALLFLDFDGFKAVNDNYGHDAGDVVLKVTAQRLLACVRDVDTVARMGGDEFAILLGDIEQPTDVIGVAEKIIQNLMVPVLLHDGRECSVGVSIGIAIHPEDGFEIDRLLSAADAAMYESKAIGKGTYTFSKKQENMGGGEIQPWIVLDEDYLLGVPQIDQQHLELVELLNKLNLLVKRDASAQEIKQAFDDVVAKVSSHFEAEERLMDSCGFNGDIHKKEHLRMLAEADGLKEKLFNGGESLVLQSLKSWLIDHVLHSDREFASFFIQQGVKHIET